MKAIPHFQFLDIIRDFFLKKGNFGKGVGKRKYIDYLNLIYVVWKNQYLEKYEQIILLQ